MPILENQGRIIRVLETEGETLDALGCVNPILIAVESETNEECVVEQVLPLEWFIVVMLDTLHSHTAVCADCEEVSHTLVIE
jgi:hypothetical protein